MSIQIKNIGIEKAMQKVRHFCAYQERTHQEVKKRLYSFGLYKNEVEELLANLIAEGYLNEERFALAFAGGKFRQLQWGKVKIKYALHQKGISAYCIKKGLAQIADDDYSIALQKLYKQKLQSLGGNKTNTNLQKVKNYLLQKGYEPALIANCIKGGVE